MIHIRQISVHDLPALQTIGRKTFVETFAEGNSEENLARYLAEGFSHEKLTKELANKNSQFYFAEMDGRVLGYLKVNMGNAQSEQQDPDALEIERIYLLKEFHGKEVGLALYQKALSIAHERKAAYIWLGVWEHNPRAIRFYEKQGFVKFDQHIFQLGDDEQTDILMKLSLPNLLEK
ncbi:GNAT family N-acetyltransferase [Aquirufa sp. 2-AUSEE-184A6]|jgi:ribosomal protein S18 acetylase RimI-like enzyme|uniref:GNAT family N-acetyltransferase n=1 Tax=Aquirufa novilacunae TaxID=3139305 RepID=A0ABW8SYY6_9BACT